jgi:hypothetical protein
VPGFGDAFERAAFVLQIAAHGIDQVRDEIVATLELHVDLGEGVAHPVATAHQAVVNRYRPADGEGRQDDEHDQAVRHQEISGTRWR